MSRKTTAKRTSKHTKSRVWPFMPYPMVLFLLLCAGTYLIAATMRSFAADIQVTAKVSAPLVTSAAVIASPVDGQHFSSIPVPVSGSCPANAAYVEIFSNNVMKGTAICDGSSNFSLSADLYPGANVLTAHVFNATDDEGPVSDPVTVIYDVPQPPVSQSGGQKVPSSPSRPSVPKAAALQLFTEFVYKGYYVGDQVRWPLRVSGGQGPYQIYVDWGDGTASKQVQNRAGDFEIAHIYERAGGYKDSFTVKVTAADASGGSSHLQFFVIIVNKNASVTAGNIFSKPPPSFNNNSWLWVAWPAYGIILVMTLSFWLGEREELVMLKKRGRLKRR